MSAVNSKKVTPEKTFSAAVAVAAAKLLGSAKKLQNRHRLGRLKLSLKKQCGQSQDDILVERGPTADDGPSSRPACDFIDLSESQSSFAKPNADRKRRKSSTTEDETKCKKLLRHDKLLSKTNDNDIYTGIKKDFYAEHLHLPTKADNSRLQNCYVQLNMIIDQTHVKKGTATDDDRSMRSPGIRRFSPTSEDPRSTCENQNDLSTRARPSLHKGFCLSPQLRVPRDPESVGDETDGPTILCHTRDETRIEAGKQQLFSRNTDDLMKNDDLTKDGDLAKDYVLCQFCQKDLSHLNSHRRTLHINNCIDKHEEKKHLDEERAKMLEAAKNKVLDCPVCGKPLKTEASRKSHIKKCATTNKVGMDQLIAAVQRQKEEHLTLLQTGQLPDSFRMVRAKKQNTASRGIAKQPKSKLDEDTQLALAISSSLQDDGPSLEPLTAGAPAPTANKKGRKQKQCDECLLLALTREQAADRIVGRVERLLAQQEEEDESVPPHLPPVDKTFFRLERLQQLCWSADSASFQAKMFWQHASLEEEEFKAVSQRDFYVPALMPPVTFSKRPLGSVTGRAVEIPGRQRSECFRPSVGVIRSVEQCEESEGFLVPSTQTAALLADLAAEADVDMNDESVLSTPSVLSFPDLQRQAHEDLLSAFSFLVNQPLFSDVRIVAAENVTLFAHGVVLHARCPALLQLKADSGTVELKDFPAACILAVLRHLYSGCLDVDSEYLSATTELSIRLGLSTLAEYCSRKLQHLSSTLPSGCDSSPVAVGQDLRPSCLPPSHHHATGKEPFAVGTLELDRMEGTTSVPTRSSVGGLNLSQKMCAAGGLHGEAANGRPAVDGGKADKASSRNRNDAQKLSRSWQTDAWPEKICWNKEADSADVVNVDDEPTTALSTQASMASPVLDPGSRQIFPSRTASAGKALDHGIDARGKNEIYPAWKHIGSNENAFRQISISNTQNMATFSEKGLPAPNLSLCAGSVSEDISKSLQSCQMSEPGATMREKSDEDCSSFSNLDDELLLAALCEDVLAACNSLSQEEINSGSEQGTSDVGGAHTETQGKSGKTVLDDTGQSSGTGAQSGKTVLDYTGQCSGTGAQSGKTVLDYTGQCSGTGAQSGKTVLDYTGQCSGTGAQSGKTVLDSTGQSAYLDTRTRPVQGESNSGRTEPVPITGDKHLYLREGQNSQKECPVLRGAIVQTGLRVDRGALQGTDNAAGGLISATGSNDSPSQLAGATEIESIEVSDDDLFSRDEIGVSPLQSTPKHSSQGKKNLSKNHRVRQDCVPVADHTSSDDEILIYSSDDSDESTKYLSGKSPVVDRTFNNAIKTVSQTPSHSAPTPQSRPEFKDLQSNVPVDRFSPLNLSNIESSRRISLGTPDNHFKTSTPVSSCILLQQNTAPSESQENSPIKVRRNRILCSQQRESCAQQLLTTPDADNCRVCKTFQLVTPDVHQPDALITRPSIASTQPVASEQKPPEGCAFSQRQDSQCHTVPVLHGEGLSVSETDSLRQGSPRRNPVGMHPGKEEGSCELLKNTSDKQTSKNESGRGSVDLFDISSSDSDLEIIMSQTRAPPSPRFTRITSTQTGAIDGEGTPHTRAIDGEGTPQAGAINGEDTPEGLPANIPERASSGGDDISAVEAKQNPSHLPGHGGRDQCEPVSLTRLMSGSKPSPSLEKNNSSESNISNPLDGCDQKSHPSPLADRVEHSFNRPESGNSPSLTGGEQGVWEGFDHLDDHNPYFDHLSQPHVMPSPNQLIYQRPERLVEKAEVKGQNLPDRGGVEGRGLRKLNSSDSSMESLRAGDKLPAPITSQFKTPSKQDIFSGDKINSILMSGSPMPTSTHVLAHLSSHRETGKRRLRSSVAFSESFSVDEEAANSSYLWSEENAPTDEVSAGQTLPNANSKTGDHAATPTTTSAASMKGSKSAWVPPSPFTPMPPFDDMNTPSLKNEVEKYGLKPVGKKRMRLILKDIYQKTHQYETDSDCSMHDEAHLTSTVIKLPGKDIPSEPTQQTAGLEMLKKKVQNQNTAAAKRENVGIKPLLLGRQKQSNIKGVTSMPTTSTNHDDVPLMTLKKLSKTKWGIQNGEGLQQDTGRLTDGRLQKGKLNIDTAPDSAQLGAGSDSSSSPEKGSHSSQDSSESGVPDVSVFELAEHKESDEDEMTLSQKISTTKDVNNALMNFFKTNKYFHSKVLLYEPLDLGVLKNEIKSAGVKCSNEKLLNFLDEKCITFTTKNMVHRRRRNRGKSAKTDTVGASQK